jgi:hypothetical protein
MDHHDDIADVQELRAEIRRVRAPATGGDDREIVAVLTTGHAIVLRIEAELARTDRAVEDALQTGCLEHLGVLLRRRRTLLRAGRELRADLRLLGARRRGALSVSPGAAGAARHRDRSRRAS